MFDRVRLADADARLAVPADTDEVDLLARWSDRAHLRFQLECLPQLVRDRHIVITSEHGQLSGMAYITIDRPNCSIRGLVVRPKRTVASVVEAALALTLPRAREAGATSVAYIGDDVWLVPELEHCGFSRCGRIISLHRPGAFLASSAGQQHLVRRADPADVPAIVEVDWSAFAPVWRNGEQTVREFLEQMPYFLLAADEQGVIGYACGPRYGRVGHVVRLAVHQRAQRQGVGTRLLRELLGCMAADGARSLSLNTQQDNRVSQSFYHSLGFFPSQNLASVYRYMIG